MDYLFSALWLVVVIGGIVYFGFVKKSRNRRDAEGGEDKARVRQALMSVLNGDSGYQLAYAHWEEQESYGRTVRTTYFRYAVAFQNRTILVFPLHIDKKTRQVQAGNPMILSNENLGKVTVKTKEKDGALSRVDAWLGDKQGHSIIHFYVDAENLRKSRWYPVNILQQEECGAFERFITPLAQQVASENPNVDAMLEAEAKEGLGLVGACISIAGALGGICLPPLGAVVCLIGLILALVALKKGAKSKKGLIVSVICIVWIAFFNWFYFTYYIFG